MVHNTLPSQDASKHQIWDAYLNKSRRYALDTIILETRSEVKVKKASVTLKWYVTHCHPKMQSHTKFHIPFSKKCRRYAPDTIILEMRSKVKVTMTQKWYVTLPRPKMHPHAKFGMSILNNIGDMPQTLKEY